MNGFNTSMFPGGPIPTGEVIKNNVEACSHVPMEQQYINNILKQNINRKGTFYLSYPSSVDWRDHKVTGVIKTVGNDYVIIYDKKNDVINLLMLMYLNYITFNEDINYA